MLRGVQQQSLFPHLSAWGNTGRAFIDACNELDAEIVISARDTRPGTEGNTLLHEAARNGCNEAALHLIEIGHIIDCIDSCVAKVTPLFIAISTGNIEMVEILMRAGASLYHTDIRGDNAFHYAAKVGSRMCKTLFRHPDLSAADYRALLSTRNIKLLRPVEMATNSYIEKLFYSVQGNGASRDPPVVDRKRKGKGGAEEKSPIPSLESSARPSISPESSQPPDDFPAMKDDRNGLVKITNVSLSNVVNTELIGKADLYAKLKFHEWEVKLPTKDNVDGIASWECVGMSFQVTDVTIGSHSLDIAVFDENTFRSDVFIGAYALSLVQISREEWHSGNEIVMAGDLPVDTKTGKPRGTVEVKFLFVPAADTASSNQQEEKS